MSGRSPPLYCTLTLIAMQGHQTKSKNKNYCCTIGNDGKTKQECINRAGYGSLAGVMLRFFSGYSSQLNRRSEDGPRTRGAMTSWACVYNYTTAGRLNGRCSDAATQHSVMDSSGRGRPKIYAVDQTRWHVHLWHFWPESVCGLYSSPGKMGGRNVWTHSYKSVADAGSGFYLLNEHHHSISRDSFVGALVLAICTGILTPFQAILSGHDTNI